MRRGIIGLFISFILAISLFCGWAVQSGAKKLISAMNAANTGRGRTAFPQTTNPVLQADAERLLERLSRGDLDAAGQIVAHAPNRTGKTRRTPLANQLLEISINSRDMHIREAALPALLALDGVLSSSGMFTHAQRMTAAGSLLGWLNDSLLTVQQRAWTVQALQIFTGASLGSDSAAWHEWWSHNSHT